MSAFSIQMGTGGNESLCCSIHGTTVKHMHWGLSLMAWILYYVYWLLPFPSKGRILECECNHLNAECPLLLVSRHSPFLFNNRRKGSSDALIFQFKQSCTVRLPGQDQGAMGGEWRETPPNTYLILIKTNECSVSFNWCQKTFTVFLACFPCLLGTETARINAPILVPLSSSIIPHIQLFGSELIM